MGDQGFKDKRLLQDRENIEKDDALLRKIRMRTQMTLYEGYICHHMV